MVKSILRRLTNAVAKQVSRNHLFEQPNERTPQPAIFESTSMLVKASSFSEIEEAMLGARLVNHWATWCAPCVEELEILKQIQAAVGADKLLGISWERFQGESEAVAIQEIHSVIDAMGLTYSQHIVENDPERFFAHFDLSDEVVPQTFVFSETFEVLFHRVGVLIESDIEPLIQLIQGAGDE